MLEYLGYLAYNKNKEGFSSESVGEWIIYLIFSIVISILCIYLSWSCNSSRNTDTVLKILYAIIAFFFGIFYLIFYFFWNYLGDACGSS
jgi:hypothetical protein